MRTLYFDCSAGVSGDMVLAAMSHALEELQPRAGFSLLEKALASLGLDGFRLEWSEKMVSGIKTHHVDVLQFTDQPLRHYADLSRIIDESELSGQAKERADQALRLLGQAEAKVHGVTLDAVHFHEIGAIDTIVDICGSMVLADALKVDGIIASPVDLGSGFVRCSHGKMPVPAPACAEIARGMNTFGSDCGMERATPTGLAVLKTLADGYGPLPHGSLLSVGYGSGGRSSDEQPTYVRAMVLENLEVDMPKRG